MVTDKFARVYGIPRIVMGLDLDDSPTSFPTIASPIGGGWNYGATAGSFINPGSPQMPYGVPRATVKTPATAPNVNAIAATDIFGHWRQSYNWDGWSSNNTNQPYRSVAGSSVLGDNRVSTVPSRFGSFRFRTGRSITFKWLPMYEGSVTQTGKIASGSAIGLTIFTTTGSTSRPEDTTYIPVGPIPNLVDTYENRQVSQVIGSGGNQNNSLRNCAWVEVSRSYNHQNYSRFNEIPPVPA